MPAIKFSHRYKKLDLAIGSSRPVARLLDVIRVDVKDLSKTFLDFDTDNGLYKMPKSGPFLLLIFLGPRGIFPTLRRTWPPNKEGYYRKNIGQEFDVVVTSESAA